MNHLQEKTANDNLSLQKTIYVDIKKLASVEFGINISTQKMSEEPAYKQLVLGELKTLGYPPLNKLIDKLISLESGKQTIMKENSNSAKKASSKKIIKQTNKHNHGLTAILGCSLILAFAAIFYLIQPNNEAQVAYWHQLLTSGEYEESPSSKLSNSGQVATVSTSLQTDKQNPNTTLIQTNVTRPEAISTKPNVANTKNKAILNFRLHGSNTIGEHLGPALLEAFVKKQGGSELVWHKTASPLEKQLTYTKEQKLYSIELHSHGSSTGFKDLNLNKADIAMSSRKVKTKEVRNLQEQLGQLNKLGNEHIIGLDGLAVIVNQNNPIHGLDINTLAKIYSGEINNWVDIGGPDLPIKLYSRDINSGTWDTFNKLVLRKKKRSLSLGTTLLESSSALSSKVSQDDAAIGFIGLNYIKHNKALSISEGNNSIPIFPTRFTISTEDYALSRRLYFYTPTRASTEIKDFARFAISKKGQKIVEEVGLISQNIRVETVYPVINGPKQYNQYARSAKRLSMNLYFNRDNKELDNKGMRDLGRLLEFVEDNPSRRLILMGFSDNVGDLKKNRQRSYKRAKEIEKQLSSRGLPVMAVEGFGELLPIANNETQLGRERNSRVEIWVQ